MRIQDYWKILKRRGWIVVLALAITAGSAFGYSTFSPWKVYRATAVVLFQPARADYGLTQSAKILLRSYVAAMWTTDVAQEIIDENNSMLTPEELKGKVTMAPDDSRLVIQIDVDTNDPADAVKIADAWAVKMVQWRDSENQRQDKENRVYAMQLEPAKWVLRSPQRTINTAAGGVFGLVFGTLLVVILEWLDAGIIYRPQEIEQDLGMTVLGVIPPIVSHKGAAPARQSRVKAAKSAAAAKE